MTDKVLKTVAKHKIELADKVVCVGLSGGADSVALTHILLKNRELLGIKTLKAVHIHHGIRNGEADRDCEFAKNFCEENSIPFSAFYIDVPAEAEKTGESIEECARRMRYSLFETVECDLFATAHNLNDNIETFFLNLIRGTALSGLCGIPCVRGKFIRPLLDCTREDIEKYIADNNLEYVTDSTNLSDEYSRNKLRHNVLPVLFEMNPSFDKSFSKCIETINDTDDFLTSSARKNVEAARLDGGFDCTCFKDCPTALRQKAIYLILKEKKPKNLSREHIVAVEGIIKSGGTAHIGDGVAVTVERNFLYFGQPTVTEPFAVSVSLENGEVKTPSGTFEIKILLKKDLQNLNKEDIDNLIDYDKILKDVVLRNRLEGDTFCPKNRHITKSLKKLFNEEKVPLSRRSQMAILSDKDNIIWTELFGTSDKYKVTAKTEKAVEITKRGYKSV